MREQQKAEEQCKEQEAHRDGAVNHHNLSEDYGDKDKASHWRPVQLSREHFEGGDGRRPVNEEKLGKCDLLSNVQDIRDKRKTNSGELGSGLEEEEEGMRSNSEASEESFGKMRN